MEAGWKIDQPPWSMMWGVWEEKAEDHFRQQNLSSRIRFHLPADNKLGGANYLKLEIHTLNILEEEEPPFTARDGCLG